MLLLDTTKLSWKGWAITYIEIQLLLKVWVSVLFRSYDYLLKESPIVKKKCGLASVKKLWGQPRNGCDGIG